MINYYYCFNCAHLCHCEEDSCKKEVGIGMSDKWDYCGCEKCVCASSLNKEKNDNLGN